MFCFVFLMLAALWDRRPVSIKGSCTPWMTGGTSGLDYQSVFTMCPLSLPWGIASTFLDSTLGLDPLTFLSPTL